MVGQASNEVLLFLPQIGIMRLLQPTPTKSSLLGEEHCIGLLNLDEKLLTSRRLCNTGGAIVVEGDDFFEDFPPVMPASPEVTVILRFIIQHIVLTIIMSTITAVWTVCRLFVGRELPISRPKAACRMNAPDGIPYSTTNAEAGLDDDPTPVPSFFLIRAKMPL